MKQFTQNKFLVLLVAILLVANLCLMLYFFVFKNHHEPERSRPVSDFVQKELGLNADQTKKFKQLRDQHRAAVKPVVDEMKKLKYIKKKKKKYMIKKLIILLSNYNKNT